MALVFQDGFSLWGVTAQALTRMITSTNMWTSVGSGFACTTANPRVSGGYALRYSSGNTGTAKFSLGSIKTTAGGGAYFGCAIAFNPTTLPDASINLFSLYDADGSFQNRMDITPAGALAFYKGNQVVLLQSSATGVIVANVYNHIEIKVKVPTGVNATDGEIWVKVNNTQVIGITGVDIIQTGNTNLYETGAWLPTNTGQMGNIYFADAFVWDSTGSYCNDWIGNKAVYTFAPDADGGTLEWSVTGVTQHFDAVNDSTPDGDNTYIAATAVNQITIVEVPTVTSTLTGIKAASLHTVSRQDAAGSSQLQVSLGGTTYSDGTDRIAAYPSYTAVQDHFYQDPDGAGNLTPSLLSAMHIKLKRTV
jgi:hypothetical protein